MRNLILSAPAALGLAGCLSTPEPVFDETNSLPLAEMPAFVEFVERWEAGGVMGDSPRDLAESERGILVDGIIVVQEGSDYYAFAMMGARPVVCAIYAEDEIEQIAAARGVTVEVTPQEGLSRDRAPAEVMADGPQPALEAFIRDQFANQRLACIANPRKVE